MDTLIILAVIVLFWVSVLLMEKGGKDNYDVGCFLMLLFIGILAYAFFAVITDKTPTKNPCSGLPYQDSQDCEYSHSGVTTPQLPMSQ